MTRWLRPSHRLVQPVRRAAPFRPRVEALESREVPALTNLVAVGAAEGGGPRVTVVDRSTGATVQDFFAYEPTFTGGVRVATGDFNGDGVLDVLTAPGPGGGPRLKVFDTATGQTIRDFFVFDSGFRGGTNVAVGDVNADGVPDIIAGADVGGGPRVTVFDGKTGGTLQDFFAFDPTFTGGVSVAAADVTGDGKDDVIVGSGLGLAPTVKSFDGVTGAVLNTASVFESSFLGGVNVAATDLTGDGKAEILAAAGPGGGPAVQILNAATGAVQSAFFAFDQTFTGGVRLAAYATGAGKPDVLAVPATGGSGEVRLFSSVNGVVSTLFNAFESGFAGGAFISGGSLAGQVISKLGDGKLISFFPTPAADSPALVTLQLKPLDINLLGLTVKTDPITVTVSADPGDGKLLGNVLTAAANLVNLDGVSKALNNVLGNVVDLLNGGSLAVTSLTGGTLGTATATGTTSILDVNVAPVHLELLGVRVDTSPIKLNLSATAGDGLILGNVLTSLTDLFNPPLPDRLNLDDVNARLAKLLADLNTQLPGFDAPTSSSGLSTAPADGSREVLNLSVPPIDLDLLGLKLTTDQIDVNADAVTGDGKLLGNVLTLLLNTAGATPENVATLNANLNGILSKVIGVLNAAELTLPTGAVEALDGVLQTLALPNLLTAEPGAIAPVLNLSIATPDATTPPVKVDLLGLVITTSNINAQLVAQTGEGKVLGNLAYNVAHLLDPGGSLNVLNILNQLAV